MAGDRYTVYLLYWYKINTKSTNTDAAAAATVGGGVHTLVYLLYWYKMTDTGAAAAATVGGGVATHSFSLLAVLVQKDKN